MHPPDERHLRTVLREEAERHHPDRAALLSRIDRGRAATPAPPAGRLRGVVDRHLAEAAATLRHPAGPGGGIRRRPALAAFTVVLLLVLGIAGIHLFAPQPSTPGTPVAAPATTATTSAPAAPHSPAPIVAAPGTTATAPSSPAGSTTGRYRPPTRSSGPPSASPAGAPAGGTAPPVRDGFLAATGVLDPYSIADWAQNDLTLTTTETLTTLKVTVRVARTDGVADAGHWTSIPAELVTTTVAGDDHELVYRFALASGATLSPGRYTFAVQYHHAAGARALTGDSYLAAGRGVSKDKSEVTGGFTGPVS